MKQTISMIGRPALALLAALGFNSVDAAAEKAPSPAIAAALASPDRLSGDRDQDERRKAADVLAFVGVQPGMKVIDMFSAGGYYTELLSRIVGPTGKVVAYNNPPYAKFAEKAIALRYAGNRLPNVEQVTVDVDKLELAPSTYDAAMFVMSYHDLYWRPKDKSWPETDAAAALRRLYAALKPGGVVYVQDHIATAGTDPLVGVDLTHRIDPSIVRRDFEKAGFVYDGASTVLSHPTDDHTKVVFDPSVQGKTDQIALRFRKK